MKKKAIRRKLNTILAKLDAMQAEVEEVLGQVPVVFSATSELVRLPDKPWSEPVKSDDIDYANLRWRTQNEDGTWRDCLD